MSLAPFRQAKQPIEDAGVFDKASNFTNLVKVVVEVKGVGASWQNDDFLDLSGYRVDDFNTGVCVQDNGLGISED